MTPNPAPVATPITDEHEYDTGLRLDTYESDTGAGADTPDMVVPSRIARSLERELVEARAEGERLAALVIERDKLNVQYAAERDDAENSGANLLLAELSRRGINTDNWDGDEGLWPTLARCIASRIASAEADAAQMRERAERNEKSAEQLCKELSAAMACIRDGHVECSCDRQMDWMPDNEAPHEAHCRLTLHAPAISAAHPEAQGGEGK